MNNPSCYFGHLGGSQGGHLCVEAGQIQDGWAVPCRQHDGGADAVPASSPGWASSVVDGLCRASLISKQKKEHGRDSGFPEG